MEQLTLQPIKSIEGHVQLPGSKSLSNRVLLLAALSEGTTLVKNLLVRHSDPPLNDQSSSACGSLSYAIDMTSSPQRMPILQDSEDIRYMVGALKALGIELEERWEQCEMEVHGCGGRFPAEGGELFLGNAGTAMRCQTFPSQSTVARIAWWSSLPHRHH